LAFAQLFFGKLFLLFGLFGKECFASQELAVYLGTRTLSFFGTRTLLDLRIGLPCGCYSLATELSQSLAQELFILGNKNCLTCTY
jgi:hypothetical protein